MNIESVEQLFSVAEELSLADVLADKVWCRLTHEKIPVSIAYKVRDHLFNVGADTLRFRDKARAVNAMWVMWRLSATTPWLGRVYFESDADTGAMRCYYLAGQDQPSERAQLRKYIYKFNV